MAEKEAVLLVGHGTGHPADSIYSMLFLALRKNCENVFLATLEGFPEVEDIIPKIQIFGAKRIWLLPFMLVAGGHAKNDIIGSSPDTCKSILERAGLLVEPVITALGDKPDIISMLLDHTHKAIEKI
jgi:sirohydrochlorin cobaltochelatase